MTISGNMMFGCVCRGFPYASNVDMRTLLAAAAASLLVNPGMRHTTDKFSAAAAEGADRWSISGPLGGVNAGETVTLETLRFEQTALDAKLLLKKGKRKPVTETTVKATLADIVNTMVKVIGGSLFCCRSTVS